jgi:hypothetical protein
MSQRRVRVKNGHADQAATVLSFYQSRQAALLYKLIQDLSAACICTRSIAAEPTLTAKVMTVAIHRKWQFA